MRLKRKPISRNQNPSIFVPDNYLLPIFLDNLPSNVEIKSDSIRVISHLPCSSSYASSNLPIKLTNSIEYIDIEKIPFDEFGAMLIHGFTIEDALPLFLAAEQDGTVISDSVLHRNTCNKRNVRVVGSYDFLKDAAKLKYISTAHVSSLAKAIRKKYPHFLSCDALKELE